MTKFFSEKYKNLTPYTPGEQPRDRQYIKLNTNESPYGACPAVKNALEEADIDDLRLYSDPECLDTRVALAKAIGVDKDEIVLTNGSDDVLNFAFMAFCDNGAIFNDITYGFYKVFAEANGVKYETVPLLYDFSVDIEKFIGVNKTIFLANPNAPTGMAIPKSDIIRILESNPKNVVVVDEAYVDFGGESCIDLINKYRNLLVTQTFSKSKSFAGGRLGYGVACKELISDINTLRYSTNPYNVDRLTLKLGRIIAENKDYYDNINKKVIATREFTAESLEKLGFSVLPSKTNFIFAKSDEISGEMYYNKLRERGILVRHFDSPRICEWNRITIGSDIEMRKFIETTQEILEEIK